MAARQGTAPAPLPSCGTGRLSPVDPCAPLPPSRPGAHLSYAAEPSPPARAARGRCRASPAPGPQRAWRRLRCVTGGGRSQPRPLTSRPHRSPGDVMGGACGPGLRQLHRSGAPQPRSVLIPVGVPRLLFRSQGRAWDPDSANVRVRWQRPVPPVLTAHRSGARLQPRGSARRRVPLASRRVSCPAGPAGKEEPAGGDS